MVTPFVSPVLTLSLYTSLNTQEVDQNVIYIINEKQFTINMKTSLTAGLNFDIRRNIFVFTKEDYGESKRTPVCYHFSGLFVEFKQRLFNVISFWYFWFIKTSFWVYYVDDIFILWDHGRLALDNFLCNVNSLDQNIKLILEIPKNLSLPFLTKKIVLVVK